MSQSLIKPYLLVLCLFFSFLSIGQMDFEWAAQFKQGLLSGGTIQINSTCVDANDNLFAVGYFEGAADFNPNGNSTTLSSNGEKDFFIAKYNLAGDLLFVHTFGNIGNDDCSKVELDANGNIYVLGSFSGIIDFDPGAGVFNVEPINDGDKFISKYDANMNHLWTKTLSPGYPTFWIPDMDVSANGSIYVVGKYGGDSLNLDISGMGEYWLYGSYMNGPNIFFAKYDFNGDLQWADQMRGTDFNPYDIELDQFENVVVTGGFWDSICFSNTSNNFYLAQGIRDVFLVNYSSSGSFQWASTFGGGTSNQGYGIGLAIDNSNNILLTGRFSGSINLSSGPIPSIHVSSGNSDIFLGKYASNGAFLAGKHFGGVSSEEGRRLVCDGINNVYLAGSFSGTMTINGNSNTTLSSNGGKDIFFIKTDSTLQVLSARSLGGDGDDNVNDVEVTTSDNFRLVGSFRSMVDFDVTAGVNQLSPPASVNLYNAFISEYTASDDLIWVNQLGAIPILAYTDAVDAIVVDDLGNSYVAGKFAHSLDFDGSGPLAPVFANGQSVSSSMGYLAKLDSSGETIWSIPFLSDLSCYATSVALDPSGDVLVAGFFKGTVDFDNSALSAELTAQNNDMFIAKYSSDGNHIWSKRIGSVSSGVIPNSITSDTQGNVLLTGSFTSFSGMDFDPDAGVFMLSTSSGQKAFLLKLSSNGVFLFAKKYGSNIAIGNSIKTDGTNNIYVGGEYRESINFSTSSATNMNSIQFTSDGFLAKLDPNGNHIFSSSVSGSGNESIHAIALDSEERVWVTGMMSSSSVNFGVSNVQFSTSAGDLFLAQYRSNGEYRWAIGLGSSYNDDGLTVDVDPNDNVYVGGQYFGTIYPDPLDASFAITNIGAYNGGNGIILKYDANGFFVSSIKLDGYKSAIVNCLDVVNSDVYVGGGFSGGLDFDNSSSDSILVSSAGEDTFIAKYSQLCNNSSSLNEVTACDSYFDPISGSTFDSTDLYLADMGVNTLGCDSLITVELTVYPSYSNNLSAFDCTSYTLSGTGVEYSTSGLYTINLQTIHGCDSTIVLDLLIGDDPVQTVVETACGEFTWDQNNQTYNTSGVRTMSYTNQYGCDSTYLLDLTILTPPDLSIQANSSQQQLFVPDVSVSYQWLNCENNYAPIFGANGPVFNPTANGSYAVLVSNQNCADTSACLEVSTIGLQELSERILLHPNPTTGDLNVSFSTTIKNVNVIIFDAHSRVITQRAYDQPVDHIELNIEGEAGVYFVEFDLNETRITKRVVKTSVL